MGFNSGFKGLSNCQILKQRCSATYAFSFKRILHNIRIIKEIHFDVCNVFQLLYSQQHVSAAIAAIFWVMLLLQQYKGRNVVSCVDVTS